jgi:hypothetical protein
VLLTFGSISLHVIAVASLTVIVKGVASGVTFASAMILTDPVAIVNAFPVTDVTAEASIVTVPAPKVNGIPPGFTLASASIVTDPVLIVRALPVTSNTEPAKADAAPTDTVSALPETVTFTFGSNIDVAIALADMEL